MGNDDGGILFTRIISGRRINVGGNPEAVQRVVNGMDVDLSGDVFRDGSPVHKAEGICRGGLSHAGQSQKGQNGKLREECFHGMVPFSFCGGAEARFPGDACLIYFSWRFRDACLFLKGNIGTGPYGSYPQSVTFFARSAHLSGRRRARGAHTDGSYGVGTRCPDG